MTSDNVKVAFVDGSRSHILTDDIIEVCPEKEKKFQSLKKSVSEIGFLHETEKSNDATSDVLSGCSSTNIRSPPVITFSQPKLKKFKGDEENGESQKLIKLSVKNEGDVTMNARIMSKSDVTERFSLNIASKRTELQQDRWSDSSEESSDDDDLIDVPDYSMSSLSSICRTTDEKPMEEKSTKIVDDSEKWMPDYVRNSKGKQIELSQRSMVPELSEDIDGMNKECQELLRVLSMPYIVAPGEAEAQCCELERAGLVEGIISDDSDVWTFGSSTVYRNLFNRNRRVQKYSSSVIKKELGISRWDAIQIAMLSGADYTGGLQNIGVVQALELISEFFSRRENVEMVEDESEAKQCLLRISDWLNRRNEKQLADKTDDGSCELLNSKSNSRSLTSKKSRPKRTERNCESRCLARLRHMIEKANEPETRAAFPNCEVFDAYAHPLVDVLTEKPRWRAVDEEAVQRYLFENLGWNSTQFNKNLRSSLRKWNTFQSRLADGGGAAYQMHITSFTYRLQKSSDDQLLNISARIQNALKRIAIAKGCDLSLMPLLDAKSRENKDEKSDEDLA
ncbi:hypothetical protein AB6A40_006571 [Gnathostoma spinigerum]|uniref:XPG-I domain-containing protein n=1 Tax=Gnathostoma spinigerum TaxID=75299 RepID=A0ABD6ET53_9BILA